MTDANEDLSIAVAAFMDGREQDAQELLLQVLDQDPDREQAWLWMSKVASTDRQRAICLEAVLEINPDNEVAQRRAVAVRGRLGKQLGGHPEPKQADSEVQVREVDEGREDSGSGYATASRVVAIAVLVVMITSLLTLLLARYSRLNPTASPTASPTEEPSPGLEESQEIKEYLEKLVPALEQYVECRGHLLDALDPSDHGDVVVLPAWRLEIRQDLEGFLDAKDRLLEIAPPRSLEPYYTALSVAAEHYEKGCRYVLSVLEDPQDASLLDEALTEMEAAADHSREAMRLLEETLVEHDLEEYW